MKEVYTLDDIADGQQFVLVWMFKDRVYSMTIKSLDGETFVYNSFSDEWEIEEVMKFAKKMVELGARIFTNG